MSAESFSLSPRDVLQLLRDHPRRWLLPAVICTVLAALFCLVRERTWQASQALIMREEAGVRQERLGSFGDVNDMKTVQETIQELARSQSVLQAALREVGPPKDYKKPSRWPTAEDVADLRDAMQLTPPHGAEFGKTEVFYLKVKQDDRTRAIQLATALSQELQASYQKLREAKYESVISELQRSEGLAEADLERATTALAALEQQAGVDLAELRMLHSTNGATSDLRQTLVEMDNELRRFQTEKQANEQLLALLGAALENPGHLLATPNSLLASQPALRRLKEGLIDAQLKTAELEGRMSPAHPMVRAAETAEEEVREQLHKELAVAIRGVRVDLRMNDERIAALQRQLQRDRGRLERLAAIRADYSNRIAMCQNRTELLEAARADLAEARAQQAAAGNVSLISPIDQPDTGTKPVGPGNTLLLLAGMLGGLAIGLGIVFLTVETTPAVTPVRPQPTTTPSRVETLSSPVETTLGAALRKVANEPAWS